ncbi:MAG: hypothetical protein ABL878_19395 [Burkholderiales bacterium]
MFTLREMAQLLPPSVVALAMLFITLDFAASLDSSTKAPAAILEMTGKTDVTSPLPGRPVESKVLVSDASDNKIANLAD